MRKTITSVILILALATNALAGGFDFNFSNSSFGFGVGQATPSITDFFNGFNRMAGDGFTGGPTVVHDNLGVLTTSPVNVLAVQGARYSAGWIPTAANGSPLWPSQSIRTRKGSVQKYDSTFKGFLNEPARTNKVTCRKHNPVDLVNLAKTGDAAAVLSVVDDTVALTAAGLINICTNGKVYKLDNSAGVVPAYASTGSPSGNLNQHGGSIYARITSGTGKIQLSGANFAPVIAFAGASYAKYSGVGTPAATGDQLLARADAGAVIYFILPQLEEGTFCTSVIPGDTLAAVTRSATNYTRPTAGVLRANDWGIWGRVVPSAGGQASVVVLGLYVSATEQLRVVVESTVIAATKTVAGVSVVATVPYTHTANIPFEYQLIQSSSQGLGLRVKQDGGAWSATVFDATATGKAAITLPSSYSIGNKASGFHFTGTFPFTMPIMSMDPKAELERLAALYP